VKFLRRLLICLAATAAVVVILGLVLISPYVQTWVARRQLAGQPGLKGSLESVSAGFGEVDIANLHLEFRGGVLTLPSLQAKVPLMYATLRRKVLVHSLVASGWTLDLSHAEGAPRAPQDLAMALGDALARRHVPFDGSLDGLELEGDVLLAPPSGDTPVKVHVTVTGGGLATGHPGVFTVDASAIVPGPAEIPASAHGTLVVDAASAGKPRHIQLTGEISGLTGSHLENLTLSAGVNAAEGRDEAAYTLDVSRGSRHLATFAAQRTAVRLEGTWKVDLRDSDLSSFIPDHPLPSFSGSGEGQFDADTGLGRLHASGRVVAAGKHLGALAAPLDALGPVGLEARFDLTRSAGTLHVESLQLSLAGARPVADVQSIQPFDVDEKTGQLKVGKPGADWLDASVRSLPLAWLSILTSKVTLAGGDAAGDFAVRVSDGRYELRPRTPLTAEGVSLGADGKVLARGDDLSVSLAAACGPTGWNLQFAPLMLSRGGRQLVRLDARASRPAGADQPTAVGGTWSADLGTLFPAQAGAAPGPFSGGSASGDFSGTVADTAELDVKALVAAREPGQSVAASLHASVYPDGTLSFKSPVKVTTGASVSDLQAEGTWSPSGDGDQVELKLTGADVDLAHLGLLAAPLAALGGGETGASVPDRVPFWGDWTGHATASFDRLRTAEEDLYGVGGDFNLDHGSIHMLGGRGGPKDHTLTNGEGTLTFDPAAALPYSLRATAAAFGFDAAALVPPRHGEEPMFEGKFTVVPSLGSTGTNLGDLMGRAEEQFVLASPTGIVRLLQTNVADALTDPAAPVSDTLDTVGSAVGSVFGIGKKGGYAPNNKLTGNTEAVLDLVNQVSELGFDQITVNAVRHSDGTIRLERIDMTSADLWLRGTGAIAHARGSTLLKEQLSLDLRLGARGKVAELIGKAKLPASPRDAQGFVVLVQPIRFGGTLDQVDAGPWHDLLVRAAKAPQAAPAPKASP
jgi:hypothetical protein